MNWTSLGDALEMARREGLIGERSGCNPTAGAVETEKVARAETLAQVMRRKGGETRRGGLVVIDGGRAASQSRLPRLAARPRLVTVNGVRVDHAALANLA